MVKKKVSDALSGFRIDIIGKDIFAEPVFDGDIFQGQIGQEVVDPDFIALEFAFNLDMAGLADGYFGIGDKKHYRYFSELRDISLIYYCNKLVKYFKDFLNFNATPIWRNTAIIKHK